MSGFGKKPHCGKKPFGWRPSNSSCSIELQPPIVIHTHTSTRPSKPHHHSGPHHHHTDHHHHHHHHIPPPPPPCVLPPCPPAPPPYQPHQPHYPHTPHIPHVPVVPIAPIAPVIPSYPHVYPPSSIPPIDAQPPPYDNTDNGFTWVNVSSHMARSYTHKGVPAGRDQDGTEIYVGRAHYGGDLIPAKVIPSKNVAYVCYNMQEIPVHSFEMYVRSDVTWIPSSNGHVPPGAVEVGRTSTGEPLYMGRTSHQGALTPGKVQRSHGCLYIPFGGAELSFKNYEVLVLQ